MPKRLPTLEERAALAQARADRRRELLDQAEQIRAEAAVLARACVVASERAVTAPGQRLDALLARLETARAALQIAQIAIAHDDPGHVADHPARLQAALGRWKRASEGWWEARFVPRPRVIISFDTDTGETTINVVYWSYGPYFYRHWREDGKQISEYFGRTLPDDYPDEEVPDAPAPARIVLTSALAREALALADRLASRYSAAAEDLRPRLHRLVSKAGRRVQRRLQADGSSYQLCVEDELLHTTQREVTPPVDVGVAAQVCEALDALVALLTDRTQLGRAAGAEAHTTLAAGLDALELLIARRAALNEALRRARAADLPEDPATDADVLAILAMVAHEPTLGGMRERLARAWEDLHGRSHVRGPALRGWRDLAGDLRRELRRLTDLVSALAQQAQAQGIPLEVWIAEADRVARNR